MLLTSFEQQFPIVHPLHVWSSSTRGTPGHLEGDRPFDLKMARVSDSGWRSRCWCIGFDYGYGLTATIAARVGHFIIGQTSF